MSSGRTDTFRTGVGPAAVQPGLWLPSWEERLAECPLVLAIPKLVESVLGERLRSLYDNGGGVPYDPVAIFSVWLYAYLEGERSSRKVERRCKFDAQYEYLSRSCRPDYSTLCRFRQSLSGILDELFYEVVQACKRAGLVRCETVAIDGTKIMARKTQWRRAIEESEAADALEEEARTMMTTHGEFVVGYNIQAAADSGHGIVVGFVATNQANDTNQLAAVLEATQKLSGMLPAQAVMDKGYDSAANAAAAAENGVAAIVPASREAPKPFAPDEDGTMRCLAGHPASQGAWVSDGKQYDVYRVSRCRKCELRQACGLQRGHQRSMKVMSGGDPRHRSEANNRAASASGRLLLRMRGPTIERRFSFLKREQGLRRFLLPGLHGATLESGIAFMAQNLLALQRALPPLFRALFRLLEPPTRRIFRAACILRP